MPTDDEPGGSLSELRYDRRLDIGYGLEAIDLGPAGNVWLTYSLICGKTLSHWVLNHFLGVLGRTFVVCPRGARAGHFLDFTSPSIAVDVDALPIAHRYIVQRCGLDHHALIIEDALSQPADPSLQAHPEVLGRTLFFEDALYHLRRPEDATEHITDLTEGSRQAGGYPGNMFVVDAESLLSLSQAQGSDVFSMMGMLAFGVQGIICSAYDAQGFVVWVRGDHETHDRSRLVGEVPVGELGSHAPEPVRQIGP